MGELIAIALWWTFDDHLAAALNMPGLGELPFWVVALAVWTIGCATYQAPPPK
jgi:hypothetical protein